MSQEILKLQKQITTIQSKIAAIQKSCQHENNEAEYGSNTGNYDPSSDCWWIFVKCLDCDKRMRFDSVDDSDLYRDKRWKIKNK
jgi:hypothetical protein